MVNLGIMGSTLPQQLREIRVGVYENPPKIYTDADGNVTGFWPEVIKAIAEKENWTIVWVPGTWEEGLKRLENNEIDMMPDVAKTDARSLIYAFNNETVLTSWTRLYKLKDSPIETILDLEGKKVAALKNSINLNGPDGLKDLTMRFDVKCTFVEKNSYADVFQAIQDKEVDAGIANNFFGDVHESKYNVAKTSIMFQPSQIQFAFTINGPLTGNLIQIIDSDLKSFKGDPKSVYFEALDQFLGENIQSTYVEIIPPYIYSILGYGGGAILLLIVAILLARRQIGKQTSALRISEGRFRALFENNPDLIFRLNRAGIFLDFHAPSENTLFAHPEEFLGENISDVMPPGIASAALENTRLAIESDQIQLLEYQLPMNGDNNDFEARFTPSGKDEVIVIIRDISARKKSERELRESEHRYQTLATVAPVGIFHTDKDGQTIYVNPTWCQISGIPPKEAMGEGWLKAVHPEDRERLIKNWNSATKKQSTAWDDYRFMHSDGNIISVIGQAVPEVDSDNQVVGYVGTITDITERKKVEDLKLAVEKAESADKLKSAFLATMSHELRTPLNSIIGFTGILLQKLVGSLNPEQEKQLTMVQNSAHHLLELINDVLDISKIEAGQITVFYEEFDLGAAIRKSMEKVAPLAEKKGLALTSRVTPENIHINTDRRRVEQILINLLNNAVKFTDKGEVRLECELQKDQVQIKVKDTGIGIKPEDLNTLFRPFQQIDTGLTRQYEGTGLGLSICRRLAELLGGQIDVESEWGHGSTFIVTLPNKREAK